MRTSSRFQPKTVRRKLTLSKMKTTTKRPRLRKLTLLPRNTNQSTLVLLLTNLARLPSISPPTITETLTQCVLSQNSKKNSYTSSQASTIQSFSLASLMMFKEEYGKRSHRLQNPGPSSLPCQYQNQEYFCSEESRSMDRELQRLKNTTLRRTNSKFFPSKCLNLALVSPPVLKEMKARSSSVEVTLETFSESLTVSI